MASRWGLCSSMNSLMSSTLFNTALPQFQEDSIKPWAFLLPEMAWQALLVSPAAKPLRPDCHSDPSVDGPRADMVK